MKTSIELHPKLRIEEMRGLGLLRVSVDLFYLDFEADREEDVALSWMFRTPADLPAGVRVGNEDPYDESLVCVAALDAVITRDVFVNEADELSEAFGERLLTFDAISADVAALAHFPQAATDGLIFHAMSAADDDMVAGIGVVEWTAIHSALPERDALLMLLEAMGCLTRPTAGLFLSAGLPLDLGSNHQRMAAEGRVREWQVTRDLENSRLRVAPYLDQDSDTLVLFCGVMSAGTCVEGTEVVVEITDADLSAARDQMREEERQGLR